MLLDGDVHNDDEDDNGNNDAATEVQTINSPVTKLHDGGIIYNLRTKRTMVLLLLSLMLFLLLFL